MKTLAVAALPFIVFLVVGQAMSVAVGRPQALRHSVPANPQALNMRLLGYGSGDVDTFWRALGPAGRQTERQFLLVDLPFPIFYGGALVVSLLWLCRRVGWNAGPTIAPVIVGGVADWLENLLQLNLLADYVAGGKLSTAVVRAASAATIIKLISVGLGFLLVVVLTVAASRKGTL